MAYLEVTYEYGPSGKTATSVNGLSLAESNGLMAFIFGGVYPYFEPADLHHCHNTYRIKSS
jgi:hypothetical protein